MDIVRCVTLLLRMSIFISTANRQRACRLARPADGQALDCQASSVALLRESIEIASEAAPIPPQCKVVPSL